MIDRAAADQVRSAPPSAMPPEQQYDFELRTVLLGGAVALVSIVFVAAGVAWPHAAGSLLRLLIATIAVMIVGGRAWHVFAQVKPRLKSYTPFDGIVRDRPRPTSPAALRTLAATFQAANQPDVAQRTAIPWSAQQTLIDELSRRLAERHSLNTADRSHHAHIRALVSESTQLLILTDTNTAAGERAATGPHLSMSHLDRILEDVEKL